MSDLCRLIFRMVVDLFRSRAELEAEILVLRQQINVLRRASFRKLPFSLIDRLILGCVCRLFPKVYDALAIVRPETVIRWHRAGFRSYWRWRSRHRLVRRLELQLADIKRQIAYHEDALQDLWIELMELRARVTAARRQIMGEDGDQ